MTLNDFKIILDGVKGVAHCYGYFPDKQEVPYICYYSTNSNPIFCDGIIVFNEESITMKLVTQYRDLAAECYIDRRLTEFGIQYKKNYEADADQKIHTVEYLFTV